VQAQRADDEDVALASAFVAGDDGAAHGVRPLGRARARVLRAQPRQPRRRRGGHLAGLRERLARSGRLRPREGLAGGWLLGIARRVVADICSAAARERQLREALEQTRPEQEDTSPDQLVDRLLVADAMAQLRPEQRQAVGLAFYDGSPTRRWPARWDCRSARPRPTSAEGWRS
jgi:hypothetical protein